MKLIGRVPRAQVAGGELVRLPYPPWHVLVAIVAGEPFAIEDSCNHAGASLAEGARHGDCVLCPMHGYEFSIRTGELLAPKGLCDHQRRFTAVFEGEDVVVYDPVEIGSSELVEALEWAAAQCRTRNARTTPTNNCSCVGRIFYQSVG